MNRPVPTPIYHITNLENLQGIVQSRGLWATNFLQTDVVSVAYGHIQERRSRRVVPLPPHGVLHDYVPFYFCPRSPMLYAIHNPGPDMRYRGGQTPMLHLVSSVEAFTAAHSTFVFTDRHAKVDYAAFFIDLADLQQLDWEYIRARFWKSTPEHPYRSELKQAEFLVHRFVPWKLIAEIGVFNSHIRSDVERIFEGLPGPHPTVTVRRDWYY